MCITYWILIAIWKKHDPENETYMNDEHGKEIVIAMVLIHRIRIIQYYIETHLK